MKKVLSVLLAVIMMFTVFSVSVITASASEVGTTIRNPIVLENKVWHTRYWTYENYDEECYNKIVVPSRGYITFVIEKPIDDDGEMGSYDLSLYNSKGVVIWEGDRSSDIDVFNDYYTHKIGLAAGTYYMNIDASFYVSSYSDHVTTKYRFIYTATSSYEIEDNGTLEKATAISLSKKYSGIIEEGSFDYDYYKINLTKGKKYTVKIGGYKSDWYYDFYNPNQENEYFTSEDYDWYYGKESIKNNTLTWSFTAKKSGYHYISVSGWEEEDLAYSILVEAQKTPLSKCKVSLSATSYTYNGKVKTPSVTVKNPSGAKLTKNSSYTVTYATGRKNVGKYKVTIKGKGNYTGTKTLYFTINPPKTTVSKITAGKKSIKVYVGKKTAQVTGYQIQYATNKNFKSAKTKIITSYKTTSTTLTKLTSKKTYYVRVRTYKTVSGKKYYSGWSAYRYTKAK